MSDITKLIEQYQICIFPHKDGTFSSMARLDVGWTKTVLGRTVQESVYKTVMTVQADSAAWKQKV